MTAECVDETEVLSGEPSWFSESFGGRRRDDLKARVTRGRKRLIRAVLDLNRGLALGLFSSRVWDLCRRLRGCSCLACNGREVREPETACGGLAFGHIIGDRLLWHP